MIGIQSGCRADSKYPSNRPVRRIGLKPTQSRAVQEHFAMLDTDCSELNNLLHEESQLMDSRRLSVLCLSPDEDISDTVSNAKEPFEGRYWRQHCRSLSFTSCPQTRKAVTNRLEYYRLSTSPTQAEDSPRGWQCHARGRPPRSWWLRAIPFFDGGFWKKKSKGRESEVKNSDIEHSPESFLAVQKECMKLREEREKLLARLEENDFVCEMYTTRLTSVLENNNAQLKQASESLRKLESVISCLQSVILAKDLELQFLKRSADSSPVPSSSPLSPPNTNNDEDQQFMFSSMN